MIENRCLAKFKRDRLPWLGKTAAGAVISSVGLAYFAKSFVIFSSLIIILSFFHGLGSIPEAKAQNQGQFPQQPQQMPQQNARGVAPNGTALPSQAPPGNDGLSPDVMDVGKVLGINLKPSSGQTAPNVITLHDTLRALFMNNRKIRGDRLTLAAKAMDIVYAEAAFKPEVNFVGTLNQNFLNPEFDDVTNDITGGTWNQYLSNNLEIAARYTLYDFGARAKDVEAAKAEYRRQEASFRSLVEEKMFDMIALYSEMRRALMQYASLNDYYAQGLEMYKVVKDRTDNDLAPQSDLEYVQLQLSEARQQLAQAEARILESRRAFEQETGIWPTQLAAMPQVAVERIAKMTDDNFAARRSSQVREMQAELDKRIADLERIEAIDMPNITAEVSGFRSDNATNSGAVDMGANGILRFNMSLYDGGRGDANRQAALYNLRQSRHAVDYTIDRAKGDSMRRMIEVKQADTEIALVQNMIRASEQIIRHNTKLFQAGLVSATFMIGSLRERAYYNVRLVDLINSRAVSGFGYAMAMGILSEQLGFTLDDLMKYIDVDKEMQDEARLAEARKSGGNFQTQPVNYNNNTNMAPNQGQPNMGQNQSYLPNNSNNTMVNGNFTGFSGLQ